MKILLLGAGGQVGRELPEVVNQLRKNEIEIIGLDRSQLDITRQDLVDQRITAIQPALVVNAAAYTAVDKAEQEADLAFAVNRDAPGFIAKACANNDIPLVHISTDYVFDGEKTGAYVEDDPANPGSVYGQSKWEGEEAVRHNLERHIVLRTSWVFGVYGKNFVYTMIRLGKQREELRIVNDQYGCPTAANAIARALVEISQRVTQEGFDNWGTYHYCGQPDTTWFHFAEAIIAVTKGKFDYNVQHIHPIATREFPTPAKRPQNSVLNCDKIRRIFGIEQADWKHDLLSMIEHKHFLEMAQ